MPFLWCTHLAAAHHPSPENPSDPLHTNDQVANFFPALSKPDSSAPFTTRAGRNRVDHRWDLINTSLNYIALWQINGNDKFSDFHASLTIAPPCGSWRCLPLCCVPHPRHVPLPSIQGRKIYMHSRSLPCPFPGRALWFTWCTMKPRMIQRSIRKDRAARVTYVAAPRHQSGKWGVGGEEGWNSSVFQGSCDNANESKRAGAVKQTLFVQFTVPCMQFPSHLGIVSKSRSSWGKPGVCRPFAGRRGLLVCGIRVVTGRTCGKGLPQCHKVR